MQPYQTLAEILTSELSIENEIGKRVTRSAELKIMYLPEEEWEDRIGFFNEGTIVTIMGYGAGVEYVDGLGKAIESKERTRIQLHAEAIISRTRRDSRRRPKDNAFGDIPVIVDVEYGHTWLAKHMLIGTDTHLSVSAAVWSGGKLDDKGFRAAIHLISEMKTGDTRILVVLIPPRLSKIEKSVVNAVPADLSEVHVKGPSVSWSAAGLAVNWTSEKTGVENERQTVELKQAFVPELDRYQEYTTIIQYQAQQADTRQQQQQQGIYQNGQLQILQQQQQQLQENTNRQQQQQEQQQQARTDQFQGQNQQQQQADTRQQQHDVVDQHQAATVAQHEGAYRDELDGGFVVLPVEEQTYQNLLNRIDFESMDATQSVRELLRLRERLITVGFS